MSVLVVAAMPPTVTAAPATGAPAMASTPTPPTVAPTVHDHPEDQEDENEPPRHGVRQRVPEGHGALEVGNDQVGNHRSFVLEESRPVMSL
jgi:hypothetical protein